MKKELLQLFTKKENTNKLSKCKNSFIKRATSLALSLSMLTGVALPETITTSFVETVHAAIDSKYLEFQMVPDEFLNYDGGLSQYPSTGDNKYAEALYQWNFETFGSSTSEYFTQELVYHTEDGYESRLIVQRNHDNTANVTYEYERLDKTAISEGAFGLQILLRDGTWVYSAEDYTRAVYGDIGYIGHTAYGHIFDDPDNLPDTSLEGTDADPNVASVSFKITVDQPFTFKVDGETMTFMWYGQDPDTFLFNTTGFTANNTIYDFTLSHWNGDYDDKPANDADIAVATCNTQMGIAESEIEVIPFEEDETHKHTFQDYVIDEGYTGIFADQILEDGASVGDPGFNSTDGLANDKKDTDPGSGNVGMYVSIPRPKSWDDSSNSFTTNGFLETYQADNADTNPSQLTLSMGGLSLTVRNFGSGATEALNGTPNTGIYGGNPVEYIVAGSGLEAELFTPHDPTTDAMVTTTSSKVYIKISNLDNSTLYDKGSTYVNVNSSLTGLDNTFNSRGTYSYKQSMFYTFLQYRVQNRGADQFYVTITPYKIKSTGETVSDGYYRIYLYSPSEHGEEAELLTNHVAHLFTENYSTDADTLLAALGNILTGHDSTNANSKPSIRIAFSEAAFPGGTTAGGEILSQILNYEAFAKDLNLGTPDNLIITRSDVVYSPDTATTKLFLDLQWEINTVEILQNLFDERGVTEVEFIVNTRDLPTQLTGTEFLYLKLTNVTTDADGNQTGTISFSDKQGNSSILSDISFSSGSYLNGVVKVSVEVPVKELEDPGFDTFFKYPNTYFLSVVNNYESELDEEFKSGESIKATLTLDGATVNEIPTPSDLTANLTTDASGVVLQNSITVMWNQVTSLSLYDYLHNMLYPRGLGIASDSVSYNLYISQTQGLLTEYSSLRDKESVFVGAEENTAIATFEKDFYEIDMSKYHNGTDYQIDMAEFLPELRKALSGSTYSPIVVLSNFSNITATTTSQLKAILNSLDPNQTYYFAVDTEVTAYSLQYDEITGNKIPDGYGGYLVTDIVEDLTFREIPRRSKLSSIVSATTRPEADEPNPEDISPEAPTGLDKKDITLNAATIYWDRYTELTTEELQGLGFEIIRVKDYQLPDSVTRDVTLDYQAVWNEIDDYTMDPVGYNIFDSTSFGDITIYDPSTKTFGYTPPESDITYEYNLTEGTHEVREHTLSPNHLYFYYVRTVRYEYVPADGTNSSSYEKKSYSIWIPVSVTTDPVSSPINLIEEREKSPDRKTNIAISFDAPIDLRVDGMSDIYKLQYSIKLDGEDWQEPVVMDPNDLIISTIANPSTELVDFTHYDYVIKDLIPGTSYSIKVRLWDTELNDFSVYSNILYTRTDIDQEDLENDQDVEDWLTELEKLLAEIRDFPYWVLDDANGNLSAIYRNDMFNNVLATSLNGNINLGTSSGSSQTFYLSSDILKQSQAQSKSFSIINGNMQTIIPSLGFDYTTTDGIMAALADIKVDTTKDFYVKVSVVESKVDGEIDGNPTVSPKYTVTMEVVGTKRLTTDIDLNLETKLLQKIVNVLDDDAIRTELHNKVEADIPAEDVIKYLNGIVDIVIDEFSAEIQTFFSTSTQGVFPISSIASPIRLSFTHDVNSTVSGYYLVGNTWNAKNTTNANGVFTITTNTPGVFIFAGKTIEIPNIGNVVGGGTITTIVAKYGLDDFFGKGENFDLKAPATTYMVAGSLARIAGASKDQSVTEWYKKNKGVTISTRAIDSPISNQAAIYYTMLLYEDKTSTKSSTIKINNLGATSNMLGLTASYKPYVAAAVQVGLITDLGLNAAGNMTVEDFLVTLTKLTTKVTI